MPHPHPRRYITVPLSLAIKLMYQISADVSHPGPGSMLPSIASVVASSNVCSQGFVSGLILTNYRAYLIGLPQPCNIPELRLLKN